MADYTATPNYAFKMPTDHANTNTWGGYNNGNWSSVDGLIGSLSNVVNGPRNITLNGPSGTDREIGSETSGVVRWILRLGTSEAETGGNAGSNFYLDAYSDAGAYLVSPLTINRATGSAWFARPLSVNASLSAQGNIASYNGYIISEATAGGDAGFYLNNSAGTGQGFLNWNHANNTIALYNNNGRAVLYLQPNGTVTTPNQVTVNGFNNTNGFTVTQAAAGSDAYFSLYNSVGGLQGSFGWLHSSNQLQIYNNNGGAALYFNVNGSVSSSGDFSSPSNITCSGAIIGGNASFATVSTSGVVVAGGYLSGSGLASKAGTGSARDPTHQYNFWWSGSQNTLWLDGSNWGQISTTSDYRMKKDVAPLGSMWNTVKALNPISYTHQDFTPPASAESQKELDAPLIVGDDVERWGFIAHELQETLVESAANGVKDDPIHVQSPNPFTVIAALTKALQEAMARIEALEAAR